MTNWDKIVQGGAEVLAELLLHGTNEYCKTAAIDCLHKDCEPCVLTWLNSPVKPPLAEDEQMFINWAQIFEFNWLARDKDGTLWVFAEQPHKLFSDWDGETKCVKVGPHIGKFSFVKWEDATATYIPDLMEGC